MDAEFLAEEPTKQHPNKPSAQPQRIRKKVWRLWLRTQETQRNSKATAETRSHETYMTTTALDNTCKAGLLLHPLLKLVPAAKGPSLLTIPKSMSEECGLQTESDHMRHLPFWKPGSPGFEVHTRGATVSHLCSFLESTLRGPHRELRIDWTHQTHGLFSEDMRTGALGFPAATST